MSIPFQVDLASIKSHLSNLKHYNNYNYLWSKKRNFQSRLCLDVNSFPFSVKVAISLLSCVERSLTVATKQYFGALTMSVKAAAGEGGESKKKLSTRFAKIAKWRKKK